ncbi:MAG: YgdI/YgdR family lipoprotein [Bacillaceae bacterium]|nr:YgdI/YgdR family lipoprotein [Bacillaceae bacterium]
MYKKKIILICVLGFVLLTLAACSSESKDSTNNYDSDAVKGEQIARELVHLSTKNVTRLNSQDPFEVSVITSQTIWPATHEANRPGTIILAPFENWQLSLVSLNLVHHPNDGPVLFTSEGTIPEIILNEIERLNPKGNINGTQVMIIGDLNENQLEQLSAYNIEQLQAENVAAFANTIDEVYSNLINHVPSGVIIGSSDDDAKQYTIPAGSWITHMDESLLYVSKKEIPLETIEALERREGQAQIYVIGPESVISNDVVNQLKQYGEVTRINGETPTEVSIEFASFKDEKTMFGWGVNKPGHGLVMVSNDIPELAITAAPFAHLGKHAPMVWLENGEFTEQMHEYLALLKPTFKHDPTEGPYNHAYLIGNENLVSFQTQGFIDEMLEIVPANGGGHGDHGAHSH